MAFTSYIVQNDIDFQNAIEELGIATNDFRIPFGQIASSFYKENKGLFKLKKGGAYPPLGGFRHNEKVKYKGRMTTRRRIAEIRKKKRFGHAYPLLVAEGRLAASLTQKDDAETVRVIQKKALELGTIVPYAKHHQYGTKRMPMRKVVFIGGGPTDKTKGDNRRDRWLNIIEKYIAKKVKEVKF